MKERIKKLTEQLNQANHQYYVLDNPQMLDFEYDRLLRELENLEAEYPQFALPDSPTKRVGGEALSKFEKVTHLVPLMSLQDVFSLEELDDFLEKILQVYPNTEFTVEPKIDGLSVALEYENVCMHLFLMHCFPWSQRWMVCPLRWNMKMAYLFGAQPVVTVLSVRM